MKQVFKQLCIALGLVVFLLAVEAMIAFGTYFGNIESAHYLQAEANQEQEDSQKQWDKWLKDQQKGVQPVPVPSENDAVPMSYGPGDSQGL